MKTEPITVIQDLQVFGLERSAEGVRVDLIGPDASVGSVLYEVLDGDDDERHWRTLQSWAQSGATVTYVAAAGSIGLIDERALFARALSLTDSAR